MVPPPMAVTDPSTITPSRSRPRRPAASAPLTANTATPTRSKTYASTRFSAEGPLRLDLHRGPDRDDPPDLLHLLVGEGDAAVGPILQEMPRADLALSRRQAMDHDLAARVHAQRIGDHEVALVGIRDVQREMIVAVLVQRVDGEEPFGGAVVAAAPL